MAARRLIVLALVLLFLTSLSAVHAQPAPIGPQFQVNTYTTNAQYGSAVACDGAGNFVVVWSSAGGGTDSSNNSVQGQRYDSAGTPLGAQFQVNTYTTSYQDSPAVAFDAAGNFIVVWDSFGGDGTDTYWDSVQAQRYDSVGVPQGASFQVNTFTVGSQRDAQVAFDSFGNFVVVWSGNASSGTDNSYDSIHCQRYDSSGTPLGGEFQVNTYTTGNQYKPALAVGGAGNFIVVWESRYSAGTDTGGSQSIQGQRYDNTGTPQGAEFQINTYTTNSQRDPAVAVDGAGNFLVVWQSTGGVGSDQHSTVIEAQRYDGTGAALGGEFQVNTYTTSSQTVPKVVTDGTGDFVVVWQSYGSVGSDTVASSIQGQRYDGAGMPDGDQFQVNAYTPSSQRVPVVAADASGNLVVSWSSIDDGTGTDSVGLSIQAQRFVPMALTTTSTIVTSTTSTSSSTTSTSSTSSTSTSSSSSTTYPQHWVPGKVVIVKPGTLAKFVGKPGAFPPWGDMGDGTLRIFDTGTTGGDNTYSLPAAGWKALGNPPGYGGQKYKGTGTPGDPCKVVLVKSSVVKAVCKGSDVTLQPPFAGDVGVVLTLSTNDHFCLRFGGDVVKNSPELLKRTNAPFPFGCPE